MQLPDKVREVLDKPAFAFVATVDPDGQPQVTPVWVNLEDGRIRFNTAVGRVKHRNIERDPRVTIVAQDPEDHYSWVSVQGRANMTTDGADDHIDRLAKKYLGKDRYPWRKATEQRVLVEIEPTRVVTS